MRVATYGVETAIVWVVVLDLFAEATFVRGLGVLQAAKIAHKNSASVHNLKAWKTFRMALEGREASRRAVIPAEKQVAWIADLHSTKRAYRVLRLQAAPRCCRE